MKVFRLSSAHLHSARTQRYGNVQGLQKFKKSTLIISNKFRKKNIFLELSTYL